ncbi:MAG: class II fumarate hydratase [SAR86 cluster bacterium]|nr:class II fumarate hydratase [SAR86 cluster bacterium]MDA0900324.1 class II fumarate hydratase [Pseudomonadota bacterium]
MKKTQKFRTEKDSFGEVKVQKDALWGAQTQRALENFPISGIKFRFPFGRSFIKALGVIKFSAASANQDLGLISAKKANAIKSSAKMVLNGEVDEHFPLDIFQTGSGTSTNMNANEVIATLASRKIGIDISPNDDVNMSQSSNDTIPTAICLSAMFDMEEFLLPGLDLLIDEIDKKSKKLKGKLKTGRTHLMDAMPIDFSQELSGWSAQLKSCRESLKLANKRMLELPQGGTAIGTGVNSHKDFPKNFCSSVEKLTGLKVKPASNFFQGLSSQDNSAELSSAVKNLSLVVMKICNDLRWMNSGPLTGLSDIELEALQPGSSIMPGKVNPVIPEAVSMACADVVGNDVTISLGVQSGNFQLNVMLPVIAYNLLKSINLMGNAMPLLATKCIKSFKVNDKSTTENLNKNPILVTALNPIIGYKKSAEIAKKAYAEKRAIIDVAEEMTTIERKELESLLDPKNLIKPYF